MKTYQSWDHVSYQFTTERHAPSQTQTESWGGPYSNYDNQWNKFFIRSVSHISAPGFFFTMGISMTMFTLGRRDHLKWTWVRIFAHHILRGLLFLFIDYLFDFPRVLPQLVDLLHGRSIHDDDDNGNNEYGKGDEGKLIFHSLFAIYQVMTALGLSMIISIFFMPLFVILEWCWKNTIATEVLGWVLFSVAFITSNVFIVLSQDEGSNLTKPHKTYPHLPYVIHHFPELIGRVFIYPGHLFKTWTILTYPVLPWIGITFLGMGYGFKLKTNRHIMTKARFRVTSLILFALFCCIRGFGGKINYRGQQRGESSEANGVMEFFIQTKYPPDLAYACITLSILFLCLSFFSHGVALHSLEDIVEGGNDLDDSNQALSEELRDGKYLLCAIKSSICNHPLRIILLFGRTPLFFYIVHRWLIEIVEALCRIPTTPAGQFDIEIVIVIWMSILFITWVLCKKFHLFKSSTNTSSWWRIL